MSKQFRKRIAGVGASLMLLAAAWGAGGQAEAAGATAADLNLQGNGVVVLNYHRILDGSPRQLPSNTTDPQLTTYNIFYKDFRSQIQTMKKKGIRFITPPQLRAYMVSGKPLPAKKCVLLTFDDIDESVYENVFPLAKKELLPFTAFVITGQAGNPNYNGLELASWREIREMRNSGLVSVGAHTNNMHYYEAATDQPVFLNPANLGAFATDTDQSIQTYRANLGTAPTLFAYPYGFGTPDTDEVLLNKGFNMIFSLRSGVVQPNDVTFFIKRVLVTYDTWSGIAEWAGK